MSEKKKIAAIAVNIWKDVAPSLPGIIGSITSTSETVMTGKYKSQTEKILRKMEEDLVAFKNKEIDRIEFADLAQRHKAAIFALYNADKISKQKPSIQKILSAAESLVTIIITKAIPIIISMV